MKAYYPALGGFAPTGASARKDGEPTSVYVGKHFKVKATGETGACIDACDERRVIRLRFDRQVEGWCYEEITKRVERGSIPVIEDFALCELEEV